MSDETSPITDAAAEVMSAVSEEDNAAIVLTAVELAMAAAEGAELPDGVVEGLQAAYDALSAVDEGEDTAEGEGDEGERGWWNDAAVSRRADGLVFRGDAGVSRDDGTVVMCTCGEARDGHILDVPTLRTDMYRENPVLFYNHTSWGDALPIGRMIPDSIAEVTIGQARGLAGRPEFHGKTQQSKEVSALWAARYLKCVSATWRPSEAQGDTVRRSRLPVDHYAYRADGYGYFFKNAELVEMSVVGIPSDPAAKRVRKAPKRALVGARIDEAMVRQVADEVVKRLEQPKAAGDWW